MANPTVMQDEHEQHQPQNKRKSVADITGVEKCEENRQKRGKKPRSQRNRNKASSRVHSNENVEVRTEVVPLRLVGGNDKAIPGVTPLVRLVEPYPYAFCSHAKARWCGRTIFDIYTTEFGSYPASYYEMAIDQGRILVNDSVVKREYLVKGGDVLSHVVHRHEPAVAVASKVEPLVPVVADTDDLVVVDKPSTMPIHPCGAYNENSLMNLLMPVYGKLRTIHRLDRLTSGLLILAKSSKVAKEWGQAIMKREQCTKLYLARVKGRFPLNMPPTIPNISERDGFPPRNGEWKCDSVALTDIEILRRRNCYGFYIGKDESRPACLDVSGFSSLEQNLSELPDVSETAETRQISIDEATWLKFSCPVRIQDHKKGVCFAGEFKELSDEPYLKSVKAAETSFAVLRYDTASDSTILLCRPTTGRMHQIRLHLQHLGHPIANDPNYGGTMWYNNSEGESACNKAKTLLGSIPSSQGRKSTPSRLIAEQPATKDEVQYLNETKIEDDEPLDVFIKRTCVWCSRSRGMSVADRNQLEYLVRSQGIWLHAWRYSLHRDGQDESLTFSTEAPSWTAK